MKTSLKVIHAFVLTVADGSLEMMKLGIAIHLLTLQRATIPSLSQIKLLYLAQYISQPDIFPPWTLE